MSEDLAVRVLNLRFAATVSYRPQNAGLETPSDAFLTGRPADPRRSRPVEADTGKLVPGIRRSARDAVSNGREG